MKKLIPIFLVAVFALAGCEKDADQGKMDDQYLVYTNYDAQTNFTLFSTFYLPDSILVMGSEAKPTYWKGAEATEILKAYTQQMEARGFTATADKANATLGLQVSYIANTFSFTDYGQPEWWWNYPGYWGSGYWGNWGGWIYPYAVNYRFTTNSFLTELVNLTADEGASKKLPIVWTSYMNGLAYTSAVNKTLAVAGIRQAFQQSPYLTKNKRN
ncbi:MAG: DUF4136 domain-containing protein [Bacteroides sp.]